MNGGEKTTYRFLAGWSNEVGEIRPEVVLYFRCGRNGKDLVIPLAFLVEVDL